jgi:hypothetical protein
MVNKPKAKCTLHTAATLLYILQKSGPILKPAHFQGTIQVSAPHFRLTSPHNLQLGTDDREIKTDKSGGAASRGIMFKPSFIKILQVVRNLLGRDIRNDNMIP